MTQEEQRRDDQLGINRPIEKDEVSTPLSRKQYKRDPKQDLSESAPTSDPQQGPPKGRVPLPKTEALSTEIVTIEGSPELVAEYKHLTQLQRTYTRRLRVLQNQIATLGILTPPHIRMEKEDVDDELVNIDNKLKAAAKLVEISTRAKRNFTPELSIQKQVEMLGAIAAIIGISPGEISLVSVRIGSIIFFVDISLEAAAQLLALHKIGHPALEEDGIENIENVVLSKESSVTQEILEKAIQQELQAYTVSLDKPNLFQRLRQILLNERDQSRNIEQIETKQESIRLRVIFNNRVKN